jgi:hypothetical protein
MRLRLGMLLISALIGATLGVSAALAYSTTYAGPKTWYQGWDADAFYDSGVIPPWDYNQMGPKSDNLCHYYVDQPKCTSRVVFIDGSGGWTYSHSDDNDWTVTSIPYGWFYYNKKPYCKNNSPYVYTSRCYADTA